MTDVVTLSFQSLRALAEGNRAIRDTLIVCLSRDGCTQLTIAEIFDLSRTTVQRILSRDGVAVQVPKWVPEHLRKTYREIASESGEEEAASYARNYKRCALQTVMNGAA